MLRTIKYSTGLLLVAMLAACANTDSQSVVAEPSNEEIHQLMLSSFKEKGIAKLERVNQTELKKRALWRRQHLAVCLMRNAPSCKMPPCLR